MSAINTRWTINWCFRLLHNGQSITQTSGELVILPNINAHAIAGSGPGRGLAPDFTLTEAGSALTLEASLGWTPVVNQALPLIKPPLSLETVNIYFMAFHSLMQTHDYLDAVQALRDLKQAQASWGGSEASDIADYYLDDVSPLIRFASQPVAGQPNSLLVYAIPTHRYVTQSSLNLRDWLPISTNVPTTSPFTVVDSSPSGAEPRYLKFYRAFDRFKMKCFFHQALLFWGCAARQCIIDNTNLARLRGTGANALIVPEMEGFGKQYGFVFRCHELRHPNRKEKNAVFSRWKRTFCRGAPSPAWRTSTNRLWRGPQCEWTTGPKARRG